MRSGHFELAHDASELAESSLVTLLLRLPAAVEAAVHAEVADGLVVRDGLNGVPSMSMPAVLQDQLRSPAGSYSCVSPHQLALGVVEAQ